MEENQTNEQQGAVQVSNFNQQQVSKWWILLSGILFTILGSYFFNKPVEALVYMVYYIAFAKIISGVSGLSVAFSKKEASRKWNFAISIVDLLFGVMLLASPYWKLTLIVIVPYMLAAWSITRGILVIISAFKTKETIPHFWLTLISGIFSVISCFIILAFPVVSTLAVMDIIGIFMIMMGISLLVQFVFLLFNKNK